MGSSPRTGYQEGGIGSRTLSKWETSFAKGRPNGGRGEAARLKELVLGISGIKVAGAEVHRIRSSEGKSG